MVLDLDELDLWRLLSAGYHARCYVTLGIKPRASCKLGKYSLNWATAQVFKLRCFLKIGLCYSPGLLSNEQSSWLSLSGGTTGVHHHVFDGLLHFGSGNFYFVLTSSTSVYNFQKDWKTACQWGLYRDLLRGERRDLDTSGLPMSRLAYFLSCTGRKAVFSVSSILSDTRGQQSPFHGDTASRRGTHWTR